MEAKRRPEVATTERGPKAPQRRVAAPQTTSDPARCPQHCSPSSCCPRTRPLKRRNRQSPISLNCWVSCEDEGPAFKVAAQTEGSGRHSCRGGRASSGAGSPEKGEKKFSLTVALAKNTTNATKRATNQPASPLSTVASKEKFCPPPRGGGRTKVPPTPPRKPIKKRRQANKACLPGRRGGRVRRVFQIYDQIA